MNRPLPPEHRASSAGRVLAALITGVVAGVAVSRGGHPMLLSIVSAIEPVGTLWVNAIRMTVIPLVVSLLVVGIASATPGVIGRIGGRALVLFALLVGCAALFAALVAPPLVGAMRLDPAALAAARGSAVTPPVELPSFREWFTSLVPTNPVKAAADGAMLPLIVFTALFALAVSRTSAEHRQTVVAFFKAVSEAMFVLVRWILVLAPLGAFALALSLAARGGLGTASALGQFLVVACGLLLVSILALYPVAVLGGGVPLRRFARACAPAQAVALSTRSSLASLPAMIDGAERKLGLPQHVTGLALPLAVSMFKFGSPILRVTGTLFVARLYGIELGAVAIATLAVALAALSFYSPGIPSGGLLVIAPVFVAFGLPAEGLGLLLAVDPIPDLFLTTANVTADMTAATLLGRRSSGSVHSLGRYAQPEAL